MAVSGVSSTTSSSTDLTSVANKTLDKNAFLKLLVTQLQNQDPMDPMQDQDFVAQLAQFSTLEQMEQMNTSFTSLNSSAASTQAFSMVDHWVDYTDSSTGTTYTGKVDGVAYEDGEPKLVIGSSKIDLSSVVHVYPDAESLGQSKLSSQAISMIGKTVNYYDATTGAAMSGKVDSVSFSDGWPVLNIGSTSVDARNVIGAQAQASTGSNDLVDQANSMVGHTVSYTAYDGSTVTGKVASVTVDSGVPTLIVNGNGVDLSQVTKIS